jgi:hypothetical protein
LSYFLSKIQRFEPGQRSEHQGSDQSIRAAIRASGQQSEHQGSNPKQLTFKDLRFKENKSSFFRLLFSKICLFNRWTTIQTM